MLRQVANGPAVVACNSCRFSAEARDAANGRRGGALLVEALRDVLAPPARPIPIPVRVRPRRDRR